MKIRLLKPLVQTGRVLPAGVIIADAPPGLKERLCREGKAEPILLQKTEQEPPEPPKKASVKGKGRAKRER